MYILIDSLKQTEYFDFFTDIKKSGEAFIDSETSGLNPYIEKMKLLQVKTNSKIYIFDLTKLSGDDLFKVIETIQEYSKLNVFFNAKFDLEFIFTHTGIMMGNVYDTMIAEEVITSGMEGSRFPSYSKTVEKYFGTVLDKEVRKGFYEQEELTEELLVYSALDVDYLDRIRDIQLERINDFNLEQTIDLEMLLVPVVAQMELNGVKLDEEKWTRIYKHFEVLRDIEQAKIKDVIITRYMELKKPENALQGFEDLSIPVKTKNGVTPKPRREFLVGITDENFIKRELLEDYNMGSTKQLKIGLYGFNLYLDSTDKKILEPLINEYPIIKNILDYRGYKKSVESYGENYIKRINPVTGRIHPNFNQTGTKTGRFSSDIQQIPTRGKDEYAKQYRNCFIPEVGHKILGVDYSGMEFRYAGTVSNDKSIIDSFVSGRDLHQDTGGIVARVPYEQVTDDQRTKGKTMNFSIIYGTTPYGINKNNPEISIEEAENLMDTFFEARSGLKDWIVETGNEILDKMLVRTALGRIRFFEKKSPDDFENEWGTRWYYNKIKREGVSTIVQGTCADIVKIAMLMIASEMEKAPYKGKMKMLLQIHDELVFEVEDSIAKRAEKMVSDIMLKVEQRFLGPIPAEIHPVLGDYWEK